MRSVDTGRGGQVAAKEVLKDAAGTAPRCSPVRADACISCIYRAIIGTSPHAPAANPQPAGLVRAHRDADASLAMHASTVAAVGPLRWWALGPKDIGRCRALCPSFANGRSRRFPRCRQHLQLARSRSPSQLRSFSRSHSRTLHSCGSCSCLGPQRPSPADPFALDF